VNTAIASLGNVSLLERPVRVAALVSAVRVALRARGRQYELRSRFEEQSLLATIVASSDDAIISKNLDGIITSWNLGAQHLYGYAAQEVIGKPVTILMAPDRHHEAFDILARIRRGERVEHQETERLRKDGSVVQVSLSVSPLHDAEGRIVGASKIARDITGRKRAEEALREANRRKDEFLATLAHELRNPLAPIRNSLDCWSERTRSAASRRARDDGASGASHGAPGGRPDGGVAHHARQDRAAREPIELDAVIRSAIETSQPLLERGGHRLDSSCRPSRSCSTRTRCGSPRCSRTCSTTPPSTPSTPAPSARGAARGRQRRDLGGGRRRSASRRDAAARVRNVRADRRARRRSQGGLGIGLTLVRDLVQMHGGSVGAHSQGRARAASSSSVCRSRTAPARRAPRRARSAHADAGAA
jgi:PAS domain S-box-containing protein